jgi:DNA helicase-2/ATP-dependent DNA helicase PcrA
VSYEQKKRDLNAMDFDDLLSNGLKLFRDHPDIARKYRERFLYVMVDEYQDTNVIQAEWVDTIAAGSRNLLVVGDDFQSIYSWRGADFRNIMSFPKRYPDAKVFKLETNYRSVPEILDVANACIAGNPEQFQKTLRAVREKSQRPHVSRVRNGEEQAFYVIDRIHRLRSEGYKLSQIAILYRAHFHAMELQLELSRQRIPYVITSGMRFFEQAHIKDVCSIIRILNNTRDGLALSRLLELLPKLGPKSSARILEALGGRPNLTDPDTLARLGGLLPLAARKVWGRIGDICAAYRDERLAEDPGEIIHRFVKAFYDQYAIETFENYDRRIEDIDQLVDYTARFETAEAFLSELALLTNLDAEQDDPHADPLDAVRLSTIHQAKGLEWDVVFVLWLADGMFPSNRSMNDTAGESEERRLFYVATTRAKDVLHLCVPALRRTRDGGVQYFGPSRFVMELPGRLTREDAAAAW